MMVWPCKRSFSSDKFSWILSTRVVVVECCVCVFVVFVCLMEFPTSGSIVIITLVHQLQPRSPWRWEQGFPLAESRDQRIIICGHLSLRFAPSFSGCVDFVYLQGNQGFTVVCTTHTHTHTHTHTQTHTHTHTRTECINCARNPNSPLCYCLKDLKHTNRER